MHAPPFRTCHLPEKDFTLRTFVIYVNLVNGFFSDWVLFYDKSVPGCDSNTIFWDEEAGVGAYEDRTCKIHIHVYSHRHRTCLLLLWDRQVRIFSYVLYDYSIHSQDSHQSTLLQIVCHSDSQTWYIYVSCYLSTDRLIAHWYRKCKRKAKKYWVTHRGGKGTNDDLDFDLGMVTDKPTLDQIHSERETSARSSMLTCPQLLAISGALNAIPQVGTWIDWFFYTAVSLYNIGNLNYESMVVSSERNDIFFLRTIL